MAVRTKAGTNFAGFVNCCGPMEGAGGNPLLPMNKTGGAVSSATTGAFRNKYSFLCRNSVSFEVNTHMDAMGNDAYSWHTADAYIDTMEASAEWMILADGHYIGSSYAYCGIMLLESGGSDLVKLVTFNFDGFGTPENYVDVANSVTTYAHQNRLRINVRQRYNSGADTMDIEVWVNGTKKIDSAGIAKPGGKDWAHALSAWWSIQQFERTAGKGGANFDNYWCNPIWNDEVAGVGPSGRPGANYAVVAHQMEADTDDAARDDWAKDGGGTQTYKHQYVDDNMTADPNGGDTYVYVGQDTDKEQEFAVTNHVQIGGGTAVIDAVAIIGEFRRPDDTGRAAYTEATIHCAGGAAFTPGIFDSIFAVIRRKTLEAGQDLRCYNLYVLALGEDIETPVDSPEDDTADQTPSGDLVSYSGGYAGGGLGVFGAWFVAPPVVVGQRRLRGAFI